VLAGVGDLVDWSFLLRYLAVNKKTRPVWAGLGLVWLAEAPTVVLCDILSVVRPSARALAVGGHSVGAGLLARSLRLESSVRPADSPLTEPATLGTNLLAQ
jgi:hypothetical protein